MSWCHFPQLVHLLRTKQVSEQTYIARYIFKIKLSSFSLYKWEYQLVNPIDLHYLWRASIPTSLTGATAWEKTGKSSIPRGRWAPHPHWWMWMCLEGGIVPQGQQGRCRRSGGTGAAQLLQGRWNPKAKSPSVSSTAPAGKAKSQWPLAQVWRHLQGQGISSSCLQTIPWNCRAGLWIPSAVLEALGCCLRLQQKSLSLCSHRAENTPHTTDTLPLCGAQQLCLPSVIYPAKAEFSNTSHLFPHQQEPIQAARHQQQARKKLCYSLLNASQNTSLHYCFGEKKKNLSWVVLTFLPIQIFWL